MRTLSTALILASSVFGLSNTVTVYDSSGSNQTDRPVSISRVFARGEIAEYPRAFDGSTGLTTQADVKTRWDDGSVQHAIVSFKVPSITANSGTAINFRNQSSGNNTGYLDKAGVAGVTFDAEIVGVAGGVTHTKALKTILSGCSSISTDFQNLDCRYWLRGSVVTQVIIEDKSARASDFGWQYSGGVWVTAPSDTYKSIHPQFVVTLWPDTPTAGNYAIHVQYIVENAWTDRMQSQIYTLTVRGGGGALSDLYSIADTAWKHQAKARHRVSRWIVNAPGAVYYDMNMEYMIYSKAIPAYDQSLSFITTTAASDLNTFNTLNVNSEPTFCSSTSTTNCLNWNKQMPQSGGRKDLALNPGWYVGALYGIASSGMTVTQKQQLWDRFIVGLPDAASGIPFHYREHLTDRCFYRADGDTSGKFSAAGTCTANAQGKPVSIDARPTLKTSRQSLAETSLSTTSTDDRLTYACTSTTDPCQVPVQPTAASNQWSSDSTNSAAHWIEPYALPYIMTGDWYFLEEQQFTAAFLMSWREAASASPNARVDNWGLLRETTEARQQAWGRRSLANAAWLSPDSTPEKSYFTQKLKNNIAYWEGAMGCTVATDSCLYETDSTRSAMWTRGRTVSAASKANPLRFGDFRGALPTNVINEALLSATGLGEATWQTNYLMVSHGRIAELFDFAVPLARDMSRNITLRHRTTGANWRAGGMFHSAVIPAGGTNLHTSFADSDAELATDCTLTANIGTTDTTIACEATGAIAGLLSLPSGSAMRIVSTGEMIRTSIFTVVTRTNHLNGVCLTGGCAYSIPVTRGWSNTTPTAASIGATLRLLPVHWSVAQGADASGGYPYIYTAASAYASDLTGDRLPWSRTSGDQPYRTFSTAIASNPMWAIEYRPAVTNVNIHRGSTNLIFTWTAYPTRYPCKIETSTSAFASSDDSGGTTVAATSGFRRAVVGSLTASTTYYYRISCGSARVFGSTSTTAAGSGSSLTLKFTAPTGRSVADVLVEHGATDTYGTSETPVACTTSCTVTINSLTANAIRYVRWSFRTTTPTTVAQGTAVAIVP